MKKLIIICLLFVCAFSARSQSIKTDAAGNYIQVKTASTDSVKVIETGKTFTTFNGEVFNVYQSAKGKLFIYRISRNGNKYKYYLPIK